MIHTLSRAAFVLGLGMLMGLALGLFVGWKVWPVRYVNVTPADLDSSVKEDYVIMIGASYARTGDLTMTMRQLKSLGYDLVGVEDLARTATERGLSTHQAELLTLLVNALIGKGPDDIPTATPKPSSMAPGSYHNRAVSSFRSHPIPSMAS